MATSHSTESTRSAGTGFIISGLVLVVLAALTALVIAPKLTQLPGDFTSEVTYDGKSWQLDPETLKLSTEATPVTATRVIDVTETDGGVAVIHSVSTAKLPTGDSVTDKTFAIDRTDYSQQEFDGVDDQQGGMVLSHVRHPSKDDFLVYDGTTDTAQKVSYDKTETIDGRTAYYFEGTTIAPVKAPATLETLRGSVGESMGTDGTVLPAATVAGFVAAPPAGYTGDPAAVQAALAQAGPEIDATYISTNTTKVWIDAELGSPLKTGQDQTITLYANLGDDLTYPLLDLNRLQLLADDDSVARLVDTASSNASKIAAVQVYLPVALAVVGLLLLVAGFWRGRSGSSVDPDHPRTDDRELAGAGR